MFYRVKHQIPGRLRLQLPDYSLDVKKAVSLELLIDSWAEVINVTANQHTNTVLIRYRPSYPTGELLYKIDEIDLDKLTLPVTAELRLANKRLTDELFKSLIKRSLRRYALRLLPTALAWLSWPVTLIKAYPYLSAGWHSLKNWRLDLPLLDATAIVAALLQGTTGEASNIMFLLGISSTLEDYTLQKAKNTLVDSLSLNVDKVWQVVPQPDLDLTALDQGDYSGVVMTELLTPVDLHLVSTAAIKVHDIVRVQMGMVIPFDGTVIAGEAMVNQASLTGESVPVFRHSGLTVMAGTVVEEGHLDILVREALGNSRLNQIMMLLDQAEQEKTAVQSKAEALADYLVPYNFALALAVGLLTRRWNRIASVLMVDYSCALKLAMPIAVISAMETAAKHHIVVKCGQHLEQLALADTVVFDKTGTLTLAEPKLQAVYPMAGFTRDMVLRVAACLEEHFPHSLATAIVKAAKDEGLKHDEDHSKVNYIVAHGIVTEYNGVDTRIGSAHFIFEDSGIELPAVAVDILANEAAGFSNIFLAYDRKLMGILSIEEPIRPEAKKVLAQLRRLGLQRQIMMTGDGEAAAVRISRELALDTYFADCLPEDKVKNIEKLKADGHKVIMVGDGVNDSPALAVADVSLAMRDASDIAREVADISLLDADLYGLIELRILARKLLQRSNRSYQFIMAFNSLLLGAGALAWISPSVLGLLHNTSTLVVCMTNLLPYKMLEDTNLTDMAVDI